MTIQHRGIPDKGKAGKDLSSKRSHDNFTKGASSDEIESKLELETDAQDQTVGKMGSGHERKKIGGWRGWDKMSGKKGI